MEENILNQELLANRLIEEEEEEFHHLNNPADGIKPIIKNILVCPTMSTNRAISSILAIAMQRLKLPL